eukprot:1159045-Pelagomonas_calceolata.AAC.2
MYAAFCVHEGSRATYDLYDLLANVRREETYQPAPPGVSEPAGHTSTPARKNKLSYLPAARRGPNHCPIKLNHQTLLQWSQGLTSRHVRLKCAHSMR